MNVVIAYRLLLGIYTGIVPDGIAGLGIGDIDWAGDASVLLAYVKGRTAPESRTLPRRAVRLLEQWLEHSAQRPRARPCRQLRGSLWLYYNYSGPSRWQTTTGASHPGTAGGPAPATARWEAVGPAQDPDDLPVAARPVPLARQLPLGDRPEPHPGGRGRPLPDRRHARAAGGARHDHRGRPGTTCSRKAHPPVVLADEDAAELAAAYPALVAGLNLDDAAVAGLLSGEQDVFIAACADPLSGLHGPQGKPCPARPWVCLLCPLAVFTPRHAANLLRLKAFFARQWIQMPSAAVHGRLRPLLHPDRPDPGAVTR